jgi:hypothetical protein
MKRTAWLDDYDKRTGAGSDYRTVGVVVGKRRGSLYHGVERCDCCDGPTDTESGWESYPVTIHSIDGGSEEIATIDVCQWCAEEFEKVEE